MRKYLKKLTAVFLVCAMLAMLAACGNTDSTSSAASSTADVSSAASVSSETDAVSGDESAAESALPSSSEAASESSEAVSSEEPVPSANPTPIEHVMKGTIEDATMNTFVLKTNDGSITFSIGADTDLSNLPNGLKIGDKVSVLYTGNVEGTDGTGVNVTRVIPVRE